MNLKSDSMKTWNFTFLNSKLTVVYKSFIAVFLLLFAGSSQNGAAAQCPGGYNQVTMNWDYLDYFTYTNYYTSANGFLPSLAAAQTQNFAFGTQRLTITNNYAAASFYGDTTLHTGETGSYGTGADVQFLGNGVVTLTFENEVRNLKFSIYDVDRSQRIIFGATNAASVPQNIDLTTLGASILVINNDNTPTARVDAAFSNVANTSNTAAVNVDIAGPVKTVTITVSNTLTGSGEDGSFFLSDITACSVGNFPNNYYNVSQPFTGQPGYILHAFGDSVMALNPATGVTKFIFEDPFTIGVYSNANRWNINSMGYDPYNKILYYTYSLTSSAGTNVFLKKYDFNTETISTVLSDITTIGIPVVAPNGTDPGTGVESGAACFYNGSFYLGIESSNRNGASLLSTSSREAVIWRIDFDGSNIPYRASQVFAMPSDNGLGGAGALTHDWSDFQINDGVLYDFDGAGAGAQTNIFHTNLLTGATTVYTAPANYATNPFVPGQPTVDWTGTMYQLSNTNPGGFATTSYVAVYNTGAGTIGTKTNLTSTPAYTPAIPSLGDAAEAFRPKSDFGDAPDSYHGLPGTPLGVATHEYDANLRLGNTYDREWAITTSSTANADGGDEDGIGAAPNLNYNGTTNYSVTSITVFNNTGADATLIGWLDYNLNGTFEAGEGRSITVPTSAVAQTVNLNWTGITVPNYIAGTTTFLRLRLTSASNSMTTANINGYFDDGEVEDFPVLRGANLLPIQLFDFTAEKINGKQAVTLNWKFTGADQVTSFIIQRSKDAISWEAIGSQVHDVTTSNEASLSFSDFNALDGKSYYRLQWMEDRIGYNKYSTIQTVSFGTQKKAGMEVLINPASSYTIVQVTALSSENTSIRVLNSNGKVVMQKNLQLHTGANTIKLDGLEKLSSGLYIVRLQTGEAVYNSKLLVSK
jgi:GEVED domain/Secretion system C-terminal sorting domain